jgi:hypothetical protein
MRSLIEVWQGCAGYWQSAFIRENLLPLGHAAWQGHQHHGRGLVACVVTVVDAATVDWSGDVVQYRLQYIPAGTVPAYLASHPLPSGVRDHLMQTVQTYAPDRDLLVALEANGVIEIDWLRHLAIAPPDCYRQVCDRWDEFNLAPQSDRRCNDAQ